MIEHMMYTLMDYAFYPECRKIIAMEGGIESVLGSIERFINDRIVVKQGLALLWNLSSDIDAREKLNNMKVEDIYNKIKDVYYNNQEVQEVVEVALRSLKLKQSVAMDPLIEKCLLQNACTFSVTGDKTYLLQVWYDCYTCNLRATYGICATCAVTCHHGHNLSSPKFGRFFCDCGHGALIKKGIICKSVKKLEDLGLERKREKDEDYFKRDGDDDPDPIIPLLPFLLPPKKQEKEKKKKEL